MYSSIILVIAVMTIRSSLADSSSVNDVLYSTAVDKILLVSCIHNYSIFQMMTNFKI